MARQTLFSILLRAPWWMSVVVAITLFAGTRLLLPDIAAVAVALPFLAIAAYAGWRQLRTPSVSNVAEMRGKLRAMSWENFSPLIAEAFRRDGYSVAELAHNAADFELRKNGRVIIVSCKRWKASQTGAGPLRGLYEAKGARDAHDCIYVAVGDFTANARKYAGEKAVTLLSDTDLVRLLARVERGTRNWFSR